jgi:hypothetical protein
MLISSNSFGTKLVMRDITAYKAHGKERVLAIKKRNKQERKRKTCDVEQSA